MREEHPDGARASEAPAESRVAEGPEEIVPIWGIALIGLGFGFMAWWVFCGVCLIGAVTIYGLTGIETGPPSGRVQAFVFAVVFVGISGFGLVCWLEDKVRRARGGNRHD